VALRWSICRVVGSVPPALLTEPPGNLASLVRAEKLVDSARAETESGRDLTDGQPRLMGVNDGPDPLSLGPFQASRGEEQPGGKTLYAPDPLFQLVDVFHFSKLCIDPLAVQQFSPMHRVVFLDQARCLFRCEHVVFTGIPGFQERTRFALIDETPTVELDVPTFGDTAERPGPSGERASPGRPIPSLYPVTRSRGHIRFSYILNSTASAGLSC